MEALQVTKPYLPPLSEYSALLAGIWERNYLTNQGPLVTELERRLAELLGARKTHFVCNGGVGLQIILKALNIGGEVITTPFSYVATTSCLLWEKIAPVYADIDPVTLTIDVGAVEAAITPQTEAILATHVYGNPCAVEELGVIAQKHGLPLIYDAAHAFGVRYRGRPILEYGDASMISLHATKVFHTVEGGLIHAGDKDLSTRLEWMRRFGHNGEGQYHGVAMNAKGTEIHAAMGLALLPYWDEIRETRRVAVELYDDLLLRRHPELKRPALRIGAEWNYAYYAVLFPTETALLRVVAALNAVNIFPRRYFWPALSDIKELGPGAATPVASDAARRVLVLPLHGRSTVAEVTRVADVVVRTLIGS